MNWKQIVINYKLSIIGAIIGSLSGFLYWYFVGCASGTCPITSSPVISSVYVGFMGVLFANLFEQKNKSTKKS